MEDSGVDSGNDSNDIKSTESNDIKIEDNSIMMDFPAIRDYKAFCLQDYVETRKNERESYTFPQPISTTSRESDPHCSTFSGGAIRRRNRQFARDSEKMNFRLSNMYSTGRKCIPGRVESLMRIKNESKLRTAASTCNIENLTRLLKDGVNPNCSDEHKRSPLHLAACRGYADIVTQLLKYGANPNILDSLGNTPLHLAIISASSPNFNLVVRTLLQHGASVHAKDRTGKNPLELAEGRLRLMRARESTPEIKKINHEMCLLIALICRYFVQQKKELEDIESIEERLQNLSTSDEIVVNEAADSLLASLDKLSIKK